MYYPENALNQALSLIKDAVSGEKEDEMFYDYLISVAPTQSDEKIIASIRDDERKHNRMFRQLYCELTGVVLPQSEETENFARPKSYLAVLKKPYSVS
jgi:rubrerythrin